MSNNELFPWPACIYVFFKMISKSLSGFFAETVSITKIMYIVNGEKKGRKGRKRCQKRKLSKRGVSKGLSLGASTAFCFL